MTHHKSNFPQKNRKKLNRMENTKKDYWFVYQDKANLN